MKFVFFYCLLVPVLAVCQDQKATSILNELSEKTRQYKTMEAHFTNVFTSQIADVNESKKGIIYVNGDAFKLDTEDQLIISDGETNWIYLVDENEVNITEGTDDETLNPSSIFTMYENGYKYKYVKDDGTHHHIELYPTQSGAFSRIEMKINKAKMEISSFTMVDKQGSQFTYIIDKFIADKEYSSGFFKFDTSSYPGVDVIDLR